MFLGTELYSFLINFRDLEGEKFLLVVYRQNLESGLKIMFCMF